MMMYLFLDETMIFSTERERALRENFGRKIFFVTVYLGPFGAFLYIYNLYIFVTTTYVRRVYDVIYGICIYIYGHSILCLIVVCMVEEGERGKE